ncbi:MAG: TPM domain-containing protein [Ignavibacteria bacterium]|nr:TPM domain-containing protein [Ignavibacteria bacterium]MBI3765622.1 TPM domain-containing protein [Ignavibacteriales bacterium]
MATLSVKIAEAERKTSGEIRVVVRHRRHWKERKLSLHELALREFYKLGMEKTQGRTGVLILLLFSERAFQIIADEGIHAKVEDGTCDQIATRMSSHFKGGKFSEGIADAISAVGAILKKYFPLEADDRDQLPNDVIEE